MGILSYETTGLLVGNFEREPSFGRTKDLLVDITKHGTTKQRL